MSFQNDSISNINNLNIYNSLFGLIMSLLLVIFSGHILVIPAVNIYLASLIILL